MARILDFWAIDIEPIIVDLCDINSGSSTTVNPTTAERTAVSICFRIHDPRPRFVAKGRCGNREAHIDWSIGIPEKGSTRYSYYREGYWPCAGGLSAMNAIDAQLRDPINYTIGTNPMAVDGIDGRRYRHSLYRGKQEEGARE